MEDEILNASTRWGHPLMQPLMLRVNDVDGLHVNVMKDHSTAGKQPCRLSHSHYIGLFITLYSINAAQCCTK